jgi:hypothetical protein
MWTYIRFKSPNEEELLRRWQSSASQEIIRLLQNSKVNYYFHKSGIWGPHTGGYEEFYLLRYNVNGLQGITSQEIEFFMPTVVRH